MDQNNFLQKSVYVENNMLLQNAFHFNISTTSYTDVITKFYF